MIPEEEAQQIAARISLPGLTRVQIEGVRLQIVGAICRGMAEERKRWVEALGVAASTHHHPGKLVPESMRKAADEEREACARAADEVELRQQADHGAANTGGAAQAAAAIRARSSGRAG